MAASWSPSYPHPRPSVPHSATVSARNVQRSHPSKARAPVHNPYDKFSKPEFDDWIGGITSALRRALGQDEEEVGEDARAPGSPSAGDDARRTGAGADLDAVVTDDGAGQDVGDTTFEEEESLSYVPSLRAKGKARDPREGPGFGGQQNPIELLSDSDQEAEEDGEGEEEDYERGSPSGTVSDAGSEELDEYEYDEDGVLREGEYYIGEEDEEQEGEEEEREEDHGDEDVHSHTKRQQRLEEDDEEEELNEGEIFEEGEGSDAKEHSPEIIELVDSDEEQGDDGGRKSPTDAASALASKLQNSAHPRHARHYDPGRQPHTRGYADDEEDEAWEEDENEEEGRGISPEYTSDRGEENEQLSVFVDDERDDFNRDAEADDDTTFPPSRIAPQAVELPDPWAGPREYAEDFYAGGDFPSPFFSDLRDADIDPSSLTPLHDAAFIDENTFDSKLDALAPAGVDEGQDGEAGMDIAEVSGGKKPKPEVLDVLDEDSDSKGDDDDALPDSSPPPPSSPPTRQADVADADYMLDDGHMFNDHGSHLNWNWPPAFPGRVATRPGHLETSPPAMAADDFKGEEADDSAVNEFVDVDGEPNPDVGLRFQAQGALDPGLNTDAEGELDVDAEGSVDDEDEDADEGPIPLGTSDLVQDDEADAGIEVFEDERPPDSDVREEEEEEGEIEEDDMEEDRDTVGPSHGSDRPDVDEMDGEVEAVQDEEDDFDIRSSSPSGQDSTHETQEEGAVDVLYDISEAESYVSTSPLTPVMEVTSIDGELGSVEPSVEYVVEDASRDATADVEETNPPITFDDDDDFLPPGLGISGAPTPRNSTPEPEPTPESAMLGANSMPMTAAEAAAATMAIAANAEGEIDVPVPSSLTEATQLPSPDVTPEDNTGVSKPSTVKPSSSSTAPPPPVSLPPPPSTPLPTTANPSVPDPLISPPLRLSHASPPRLISIPGTPRLILSPLHTPGVGVSTPTPVSVNVSTSIIRALSRGQSFELGQPVVGVNAGASANVGASTSSNAGQTLGADAPPSGPNSALEPSISGGPSGLFTPLSANGDGSSRSAATSRPDGDGAVVNLQQDIAQGVVDALVQGALTPTEKWAYEGEDQGWPDADQADDGHGEVDDKAGTAIEEVLDEDVWAGGPFEVDKRTVDDEAVDGALNVGRPLPDAATLEADSSMMDAAAIDNALNARSSPPQAEATELEDLSTIHDDEADAEGEDEEVEEQDAQKEEGTAAPPVERADSISVASLEYPPSDLTEPEDEEEAVQAPTEEVSVNVKDMARQQIPPVDVNAMQPFTTAPHHDSVEKPDPEDKQTSSTRLAKRRRSSSDTKPARLTRSASNTLPTAKRAKPDVFDADQAESGNAAVNKVHDGDEQDAEGSDFESSDGASVASKMLKASRESSVVSNTTSSTRPSLALPPPTFHAGVLRHQHNKPASLARGQSLQQVTMKPIPPLPLAVPLQTLNLESQPPVSPSVLRTQSLDSAVVSGSTSSSPVTRSNCRFHKISLPKEEGGPRVCFVVPGCSLGDKELMDEEEIEDHGPATYEDYRRLLGDIEALDCFSSDLVGVLRQLVGVDLLRENEVFYLVQPGEEAMFSKRPKKSKSRRESRKSTGLSRGLNALETSSVAERSAPSTPTVSKQRQDEHQSSPMPSSIRPPESKAESALTFASSSKHGKSHGSHDSIASSSKSKSKYQSSRGESRSASSYALSDDAEGDDEDDEGAEHDTQIKKRENGLQERSSSMKNIEEGSEVVTKKKKERPVATNLTRRRSKRLHPDAAAYQPKPQEEEESSEDEAQEPRRRKRAKKGTKRTLADGEEASGESHKAKRPRKTDSIGS